VSLSLSLSLDESAPSLLAMALRHSRRLCRPPLSQFLEAEDLAQEALVALLEEQRAGRAIVRPQAFLLHLLRARAASLARAAKLRTNTVWLVGDAGPRTACEGVFDVLSGLQRVRSQLPPSLAAEFDYAVTPTQSGSPPSSQAAAWQRRSRLLRGVRRILGVVGQESSARGT
ncbi:MAG: hypothetical protein KF830_15235, partial [Planctomycetes bacterium]|nr:hypothetical protein [Planctomycetota bacterium]